MKNKNIQLYLGDSKEVLKQLADNSVDLIVTDPPYQLDSIRERFGKENSAPAKFGKDGAFQRASKGFMGKKWDVLPPIEVWEECLRVLKPGAFAFVMTTPRQDSLCQILMDLSQAGFCMGFSSIYWTYATGFPKASNISKLIDKQECKKELTKKLGRKPTKKEFDEAWKNFREKTGEIKKHAQKGVAIAEERTAIGGGAFGETRTEEVTKAKSPQAKKLDGSYGGFQSKPAVEIIIVAMKPLSEKSYINQALKNGKGITWLDNCRVPYESENVNTKRTTKKGKEYSLDGKSKNFQYSNGLKETGGNVKGRFPANLIVSNDVLNDGKISKSKADYKYKYNKTDCKSVTAFKKRGTYIPRNDSGSYSRYFDLDKWWIERVKKLPLEVQKVFPYLIVPKASKREKNKGLTEKGTGSNTYNRKCLNCGKWQRKQGLSDNYTCHCEKPNWEKPKGNAHPTVKPLKLMSYLITLGSKKGEVILDPFMGSGTTGISAKLLDRKFIGIEMSEEYIKIAQARLKGWKK